MWVLLAALENERLEAQKSQVTLPGYKASKWGSLNLNLSVVLESVLFL